jgi:hypothetical protein
MAWLQCRWALDQLLGCEIDFTDNPAQEYLLRIEF